MEYFYSLLMYPVTIKIPCGICMHNVHVQKHVLLLKLCILIGRMNESNIRHQKSNLKNQITT